MIIGKYNYGVKFSILPPRCLGWNWSSNAIIWNTFHANTQIEEIILVLYFNNTINFVSQVTGVPQFWRSSQYRNWGALFSSLCGVVWQHSINPRQCWPVLGSSTRSERRYQTPFYCGFHATFQHSSGDGAGHGTVLSTAPAPSSYPLMWPQCGDEDRLKIYFHPVKNIPSGGLPPACAARPGCKFINIP